MPRLNTPSTGLKPRSQRKPTTIASPRLRSPSEKNRWAKQNMVRGVGIITCGLVGILAQSHFGHEITGVSENLQMWATPSRELQIFAIDELNFAFEQIPMIWGIALVFFVWGIALALTFIVSLRETQSEQDQKIFQEPPMDEDDSDSDDDWGGMPGRRLIH